MAFERTKFVDFAGFLKSESGNPDIEKRIVAENFILEERLTEQREDSYKDSYDKYIPSSPDSGWKGRHENYLAEKIHIKPGTPEISL